ncbi:MAG: hypothetical protein R3B70_10390 [Polyangiaceae bacterium]
MAIHQGSNPRDPEDAEYIPGGGIDYGRLIDTSITGGDVGKARAAGAGGGASGTGGGTGSETFEEALYLSRRDPLNNCTYPRRCAVGTRRVVKFFRGRHRRTAPVFMRYQLTADTMRRSASWFGARIMTDASAEGDDGRNIDNTTFDIDQRDLPTFANKRARQWRVTDTRGSARPVGQISFLDATRLVIPTNDGATSVPLAWRNSFMGVSRGTHGRGPDMGTLLEYVAAVESGAAARRCSATRPHRLKTSDRFGSVLKGEAHAAGVDLTTTVTRTFESDTERWVLGQLRSQEECSSSAMQTQCRKFGRTTTEYGEIETESVIGDGDGNGGAGLGLDPTTKLEIAYERDRFGNIVTVTGKDSSGTVRSSKIGYEAEGLFPTHHTTPAGHLTVLDFDPRLGVVTRITDPNGLPRACRGRLRHSVWRSTRTARQQLSH